MNQDGWGQSGAGASDMRVGGKDLQHNRQTRTADEVPGIPHRMKTGMEDGGPMKMHLDAESSRHAEGRAQGQKDLERHYSRHYDSRHKG
jgi:hypothetical protein